MSTDLLPFTDFVRSLRKRTRARALVMGIGTDARVKEGEAMRRYLQRYYRGAEVPYSYQDDEGQVWDCMPVNKQPALRGRKRSLIGELPATFGRDLPDESVEVPEIVAPSGTVPVRRLTLEEMARYETLNNFLSRGREFRKPSRYHIFGRQITENRGAEAIFSVWKPRIINSAQIFSLAQTWVVGGRDSRTQTIEAGWHVLPQMYGHDRPVFFIFCTPDNYTTNIFNLDKDAFVLDPRAPWKPGAALSPHSEIDGRQVEMRITWYFNRGVWCLYVNKKLIGYYRRNIFKGGALTGHSDTFLFGGEVSGTGSWGPMGSGRFAGEGYRRSAYIRNISWFDKHDIPGDAQLEYKAETPNCYTCQPSDLPDWGTQFFYGGPGGNNC